MSHNGPGQGLDRLLSQVGLHRLSRWPPPVLNQAVNPTNDAEERTALVALYSAYLEDMGRIGGRHENTRTFYLSVISALFVFLALTGTQGVLAGVQRSILFIVGAVGVLICVAWYLHMTSFGRIYVAKRRAIATIEVKLPVQPFQTESEILDAGGHLHLTTVDKITAVVCAVLFGFLVLMKWTPPPVPAPGS